MGIGSVMRTSVSGMNAQANRLSAVSENIANSNTTGYKRATTEFSSMVLPSTQNEFNSGVVTAQTRTLISQQGGLSYTTNSSSSKAIDLAVNGNGFFVVGDTQGGTFLTRAGSFVKNGEGALVNAAGFKLQGYPLPLGDTSGVANGFAGLVDVNLNAATLRVKPTDGGLLTVNLPKTTDALPTYTGVTGAATAGTATQSAVYGVTGTSVPGEKLKFTVKIDGTEYAVEVPGNGANGLVDVGIAEVVGAINAKVGETIAFNDGGKLKLLSQGTGTGSKVEMLAATAVKPDGSASAAAVAGLDALAVNAGTADTRSTTNSLPSKNLAAGDAKYTSTKSIVTYDNSGKEVTLDVYFTKTNHNEWEYAVFDRANAGTGPTKPFPYTLAPLTTGTMTFGADNQLKTPTSGAIDITIPNGQTMRLDLSASTQTASDFQVLAASVNGNPPENVDEVSVAANGIITAKFKSGTEIPLFKIPLALVESPDNMTTVSGNVFNAGLESGTVLVGFGGDSGMGSIVSGALENSTVDLASELTTMIESQRSYTANSKVFQTGSEILDVLVNLKR